MLKRRCFSVALLAVFAISLLTGAVLNIQAAQTTDWSMFRRDPAHTGYADTDGPEEASKLWTYKTGYYVWPSPAVVGDRVFVGSGDYNVYCLNASTGEELWTYKTGDYVSSSPAVVDGKVYVGSDDDNVYCLNASTGKKIWNYATGGDVRSSPTVLDCKVYVVSEDYNVYCLNASTGVQIWNYTTSGRGTGSSPAIAGDRVYVGSFTDVYCLNASTGVMTWKYATGSWVESSPAVVDDKVYVGSYDYNVYCLDALTGAELWNYKTGGCVSSSPAVVDGKIYVGSDDDNVYCLDASTGAKLWNYKTGDNVLSSPAVVDDKVYVGSYDYNVYCLNASTGVQIWSYATDHAVQSSPAVVDGKVYVGSHDSNVYCLAEAPPTITGVTHTPTYPANLDSVTVSANVSDVSGISQAILSYHNGSEWNNMTMSLDSTSGFYQGAIPALPENTTVQYKVYAEDTNYNWAESQAFSYTVVGALGKTIAILWEGILFPIVIVCVGVIAVLGVPAFLRARESQAESPIARAGTEPEPIYEEEATPVTEEFETPESVLPSELICPSCGHVNPSGAIFCIRCGRHLGET